MIPRQTTGSVVCPRCGRLVGVTDAECYQCGRRNPGMWGYAPLLRKLGADLGFVPTVIGGSVLLYVISLLLNPSGIGMSNLLGMLSPDIGGLFALGASGPRPVFVFGRWWTVLSAGWLHGSLLHILFNMLWVRQLGPVAVQLFGVGRTFLIYTLASVAGFILSAFGSAYLGWLNLIMGGSPNSISVGASAAVFGLLGALVYAGGRTSLGEFGRQVWTYAIVLFVFGLLWPGVDNWAHLGGFLGGYFVGRAFDPLKPETVGHLFAALGALALTALSIVYSFVTFLALTSGS